MKSLLSTLLAALLLLFSFFAYAQRPQTPQAQEKERNRIINKAPIVFLGRPLQSEFYQDKNGIVYLSTVVQVLEVLRGQNRLRLGTVEYIDSFEVQTPELREAAEWNATTTHEYSYSIYFSSPSTYPARLEPFITTNGSLQIKPFENIYDSKLSVELAKGGYAIGGLYKGWETPEAMLEYINSLPNIRRLPKSVDNQAYPEIKFNDLRKGKAIPRHFEVEPVDTANWYPISKPISNGKYPVNLSKEDIEYLPRIMKKIDNGEVLSKRDSAFINKNIPDIKFPAARKNKNKVNGSRLNEDYSRGGPKYAKAVRAVMFNDTTLNASIRNLRIVEKDACNKDYQGELWFKSSIPNVFLGQFYLEIDTNADFELENGPFGPSLLGTFTPLEGTPEFMFFQSYDTITQKIIVFGYPSFTSPQRIALSATNTKAHFQFRYPVAARLPSTRPRTLNFALVHSEMSRSYTNYYFAADASLDNYASAHQFVVYQTDGPVAIKRPRSLVIDSIRGFDITASSIQTQARVSGGLNRNNGIDTLVATGKTVSAGTGMLLKIHGEGFMRRVNPSDTIQKGRIQFVNADLAPTAFLFDVDKKDVLQWRDTLIIVRIPDEVHRESERPYTVGGGPIRVVTYCSGEYQSLDTLDIQYNLDATALSLGKRRTYLASIGCSEGITFKIAQDVAATPGAESTIRAALRHWSRQLSIRLNLEVQAVSGFDRLDNVNTILFSASAGNGMLTKNRFVPYQTIIAGSSARPEQYARTDSDILISPTLAWQYDTTSAPIEHDAYAALLHEIGHVLGLNHVVRENDIMFFQLSSTRRKTLLNERPAPIMGATKALTDAKGIKWSNEGKRVLIGTIGIPLASCNTQNRIVNDFYSVPANQATSSVYLYPNPSTDEAVIVIPKVHGVALQYAVLDVHGRTIIERSVNSSEVLSVGKGLPAGLYLVKVVTTTGSCVIRMVRAR